jgi:hypothetical protein
MDYEQSEIRREIESTRADLAEKLSDLETRVGRIIAELKRLPNIKYQVQNRPWVMMGLSVMAGFLASRVIFPGRRKTVVRDNAGNKSGGFLAGVVSSVLIAVAREMATGMVKNWSTYRSAQPTDLDPEEPRRLH